MKQSRDIKSLLSALSRAFTRRKFPSDPAAFRSVFDRFKGVLENNNRALETITDMGEKLGGDYLFDIVYVRKAYASLKNDMEHSLRAFDALTQGAYEGLRKSFEHIDSLISRMADEALPAAGDPVLFFEEIP